MVCGFNPGVLGDDSLLVGQAQKEADGSVLATLVNYACHPTTLGWDNRLVSPDFVGAMRELVESNTDRAPCLFLQGASGELAPALQYATDTALADSCGKRLAYDVLAALEGMPPPGDELVFEAVVESGAPLAVWRLQPFDPPRTLAAQMIGVDLPLKPRPRLDQEVRDVAEEQAESWRLERAIRADAIAAAFRGKVTHRLPVWLWRLGDAILVGQPQEAYSHLQRELRADLIDHAVAVLNLANDDLGVAYLPPDEFYDDDVYTVWQSPFERGSLEALIAACQRELRELIGRST
jgi:hypothetical protein